MTIKNLKISNTFHLNFFILHFTLSFFILIFAFSILVSSASAATIGASPSATSGAGLNRGLVGYWTFDGKDVVSGVAQDKSGNGNNGNLVNIATSTFYTAGKIGQGFKFDGVDDYGISTSNLGISGDASFTMCAWIKWTGTSWSTDWPSFMGNNSTGVTGQGLSFTVKDGRPAVDFWNNRFRATNTLLVNNWYHLCGTKTSGTIAANTKIYVNSSSVSGAFESADTAPNISNSPAIIGRLDATRWFTGLIDDVRIYNRALSATEVKQLYDIGSATKVAVSPPGTSGKGLNSGLVGYWTFDGKDVVNGVAQDKSGNGNNGSLINIATSTFYTAGKIGQAFKFDGVNDYLAVNYNLARSNSSATFWVKTTTSNRGILQWSASTFLYTNYTDRTFYVNSSGSVKMYVYGGGTCSDATNFIDGTTIINDGKWHYVTGTWTTSSKSLYIDGVFQTSNGTGIAAADPMPYLSIGFGYAGTCYNPSSGYFPGFLDDVRIYNRALSAAEVKQLYNLGR